jgi:hypothetical protein
MGGDKARYGWTYDNVYAFICRIFDTLSGLQGRDAPTWHRARNPHPRPIHLRVR